MVVHPTPNHPIGVGWDTNFCEPQAEEEIVARARRSPAGQQDEDWWCILDGVGTWIREFGWGLGKEKALPLMLSLVGQVSPS